jgi:hypothetical protein
MRITEFDHQPFNSLAAEQQPPAASAMALIAVPFACRCIFPVDPGRNQHFTTGTTIKMAGMTIGDAAVKTIRYTRDGRAIVADLTGTLPIFATAIMNAIDRAKASEIEIEGLGMKGVGKIITFEIGDVVTQIDPVTGDTATLYGANR